MENLILYFIAWSQERPTMKPIQPFHQEWHVYRKIVSIDKYSVYWHELQMWVCLDKCEWWNESNEFELLKIHSILKQQKTELQPCAGDGNGTTDSRASTGSGITWFSFDGACDIVANLSVGFLLATATRVPGNWESFGGFIGWTMTLFLVLRLEMISLGFSKLGQRTRNTLEGEIKVVISWRVHCMKVKIKRKRTIAEVVRLFQSNIIVMLELLNFSCEN